MDIPSSTARVFLYEFSSGSFQRAELPVVFAMIHPNRTHSGHLIFTEK